ncbi:MAG: antitoxin family protein [Nitrospirae bacterium]|nr:antitoxin family protein [Nitrospirota bacterium]
MKRKTEAVYENGTLKLAEPLPFAEQARVYVTVEDSPKEMNDDERKIWLRESEQSLTQVWDNPDDDVYNELLQG